MKFVDIKSAKVPFDVTVFIKDNAGQYAAAKLVKEEKSATGTLKTFEIATFATGKATMGDPVLITNAETVAVPGKEPKPKTAKPPKQ